MYLLASLLLVFSLVFGSSFYFAQGDEQCQTIVETASMSSSCESLGNCTGLQCFNATSGVTTSFTVDKCQDPLLVTLKMLSNNETILYKKYNTTTTITVTNRLTVKINITRNSSFAWIKIDSVDGWLLIPVTPVPLNASKCMCQSIQDIVDGPEVPFELNCMNNSECSGLQCSFSFNGQVYNVETEILPCTVPPGFLLIIRRASDGFVVYNRFFNSSANTSVLGFPLHVVVMHRQYSMIVEVVLTIAGQDYPLVPMSQIILDKSSCAPIVPVNPSVTSISSSILFESVTPIIVPSPYPATCEKIKEIAENTGCRDNRDNGCDTVSCSLFGYVSKTTILPCHNPPGFHVIIIDPDNIVLYDEDITETTNVHIPVSGITVTFTVDHDVQNAIGLKVSFSTPFGLVGTIIPHTEIPIDPCLCVNAIVTSGCEIYIFSTTLLLSFSSSGLITTHIPRPQTRSRSSVSYTAVAIAVPLVVICIGVVIVAVIIIGTVIIFKHKIKSHLHGDKVVLTELTEEKDDDC